MNRSSAQQDRRLERILLLLEPGTKRQSALDALLDAQITPSDPLFHQWLTPQEFAERFAPSKADATAVASWLRSQGFVVEPLPASRQWIEFSGSTEQMAKAFHALVVPSTAVMSAAVASAGGMRDATGAANGPARYQFSSAPQLPASIAPMVKGFVSLDGTLATAAVTPAASLAESDAPAESLDGETSATSLSKAGVLSPALVRALLGIQAVNTEGKAAEENGAGETIAIPSRSNVREEDFDAFRRAFSLPASTLKIQPAGSDPGRTGDEGAAMLAASWAGVAAPGASILVVPAASTNATDGLDLALASVIDGAWARTVSVGYSSCEAAMSPAHQAFYAALYRQAAAEGIAVIAASGDSGAAACRRPEAAGLDGAGLVQSGLGVNALASTPWNTAAGAVGVVPGSGSSLRAPGLGSGAFTAWQPAPGDKTAYATGGGASKLYSRPAWQSGEGVLANDAKDPAEDLMTARRLLPDISLPTAANTGAIRGLVFCFSGDSFSGGSSTADCRVSSAGGSAAAAAIFAGVAARLAQKYGPLGNPASNLYALERRHLGSQQSAVPEYDSAFWDITSGSAQLPCEAGSPDCSEDGQIGFRAGAGYDLASGLGAINADALIANWAAPQATGTAAATVEMTTVGGVTYNPSATVTLTAKVLSGSGGDVPTGTVQFFDETTSANTGKPVTLSSTGIATYSETGQFTNGGHNIAAKYSGDTTYEAAESQPVTINIQPSATAMTVTPSTTKPAGGSIITVTGVVTATNPGATPPTGLITVNLDGIAQGSSALTTTGTTTSAMVSVTVPAGGAHTVQGTYAGDSNYDNSTSPAVTVTVSKLASVTTIAASPSAITTGEPETFTATVAPATAVTGTAPVLGGTVSFYDSGTTLLGTAPVTSNTAILTGITLSSTATHIITAVYSGDATYSTSTSSPLLLNATLAPVTVTLTASTAILAPGQAVTLTAVVTPVSIPPLTAEQHPSGYVLFYAGKVLVGTQAPVLESTGDSSVASTFVSSLPAGVYVITAVYSGDPTYGPATSNSLNLAVEDFTVSCSATSITMVQGTTQAVPCTVASLGGLSGAIQVVCEEQNPPTLGAIVCTFSPSIVQSSGSTTLSVVTTAGNISENRAMPPVDRKGSPPWQSAGGGMALALAGLLLSPFGQRARRLLLRRDRYGKLLILILLLAGMAGATVACSNSVMLATNTGTPLGEHTLKITAAAVVNTVTVSHYTYLTVNVTP